ncbi:MAG: RNA recognition motif domain-containing protein [Bacteriovoracia bacterium]
MNNNTLYLSNLSYNRDRNGLKSLLAPFGRILNIKIVMEPTTQQSRGMAFVEMSSAQDAKSAMDALDQKIIDGRTLKVKYATPLKQTSISRVVKVDAKDKKQKDLDFRDVQLMKKARNDARRARKPF